MPPIDTVLGLSDTVLAYFDTLVNFNVIYEYHYVFYNAIL